jgi:hypothetical protein
MKPDSSLQDLKEYKCTVRFLYETKFIQGLKTRLIKGVALWLCLCDDSRFLVGKRLRKQPMSDPVSHAQKTANDISGNKNNDDSE